jgi:hypothetical protein
VRQGKEAIDAWRQRNPDKRLKLAGASLAGQRLAGANLSGADLQGANLSGACLEGADLADARLERAAMERADLTGARLRGARLRGSQLSSAELVRIGVVPFWRRIVLPWQFPFRLDLTRTRDTHFEPSVSDPWSILRRNYTGAQFALHLLFLIVFALPFFLRSLYWRGMNEVHEIGYNAAVAQVRMATEHLHDSQDEDVRSWLRAANDFLERQPPVGASMTVDDRIVAYRDLRGLLEAAARLEPSLILLAPASLPSAVRGRIWAVEAKALLDHLPLLRQENRERPMWHVLVGLDKGPFYFLLVLLPMLLYNVLRACFTYKVSLLRAAEERSGYSPRWSDYGWLYWLHQPMRFLLVAAAAAFCFNAWQWLTERVVVPW